MSSDMVERVAKLEDDLYRAHPENPGALLRLDRVERLLSVMLKIGGVLGAAGIVWKALDVVGQIISARVGP